jgi:hypothetical protein
MERESEQKRGSEVEEQRQQRSCKTQAEIQGQRGKRGEGEADRHNGREGLDQEG